MARIETLIKRPVGEIRGNSEYERLRKLNKQRLPKRTTSKYNPIVESPRVEKELALEERESRGLQKYRIKKIIPSLGAPDVARPVMELPINRKLFEVIKTNETEKVLPTVEEMRQYNENNLPKISNLNEEVSIFEKGQINPAEVKIGLGDVVRTSLMEMAMDSM